MRRLIALILQHPRWAIAAVSLLLLVSLASLTRLHFDNTPDSFFMRDDATLARYTQFKQDFGSDEYSFVVLQAPPRWTPEFISRVRGLADRIAALPDVTRVTSIANVRHVRASDGGLDVGPFLGDASDAATLATRRETALTHPFYRNFLVSADGRYLGILAETTLRPGEVGYKIELTRSLRAMLAEPEYAAMQPRLVGAPVIDADVFTIVNRESAIFSSLSFVLVALGFYVVFRSWRVALLPLAVASLAIVVAMAATAWIRAPLGMLTAIIPSFLISVGVGSSVFLLAEIYRQQAAGRDLEGAIREGFSRSAGASALSVLTTAGALLTFCWSEIKPVQGVGFAMAVGLLASLVIGWVLIPLALTRLKLLPDVSRTTTLLDGRIALIQRLMGWVTAHWRTVLVALVLVVGVAVVGLRQLRTDYYYVGMFQPRTDIYQSYQHVDRTLRGAASMELLLETPAEEGIKDPAVLRQMRAMQDRLEAQFPELALKTYSLADVVMEVNQALHDGRSSEYRIPDTRAAVAEALLLFEASGSDELGRVATADYGTARVHLRMKYRPDSEYQPLLRAMREQADAAIRATPAIGRIEVTGVVPLWSRLTGYLRDTELRSISLSALIVLAVMVLVFRSLTLGVAMALCNLVPVALALAVMGYAGIFLDPFTLLISAIAIGVLDDDTLHFVKSVLGHYRERGDMRQALMEASASTGLAMLMLSVVLVLGFLVYLPSEVQSLAKFGGITALAIGLGALCEFVFTPAVLMGLERLGWLRGLLPRAALAPAPLGEQA